MNFDRLVGASSRLPFALLLSLRSQLSDRFTVSGLTVFAVAASVSLAMSVEVASRALHDGLRTTTQALIGAAALTISAGDAGVPEGTLEQVTVVPGVASASPMIRRTFRLREGENKGHALHVVGLDFLSEDDVRRYEVSRAGVVVRDAVRLLALPNSMVISEALANRLGISIGDSLPLLLDNRPIDLVVRGILGGDLADAFGGQIAAMDIYALQQLVGMNGRFERIDVALDPGEAIEDVARRIEAAVGPSLSISRDMERESFGLALLRTYQRALWAFVLIALATSALLTYAVSSMSIDRRLEELSLLRAAGMEGVRVGRTVLADALVIAALGTALGAALAPFLSRAVFGVLAVASASLRRTELGEAELALSTIAMGGLAGMASVVAAAVPAARRAARIGPLELVDLGRGVVRLDRTRTRSLGIATLGAALLLFAWAEVPVPDAVRVGLGIVGGVWFAAGLGSQLVDRFAHPTGLLGTLVPRVGFLIGSSLRDRPVETALTLAAWTTISAGLIAGTSTIRSYTGSIDAYYYGLYGESAILLMAGDPFGSDGGEAISPGTMAALRASGRVEDVAAVRGTEIPFRGHDVVVTSFATDAISRRGDLAYVTRRPEEVRAVLAQGELVMSDAFGERFGVRVGDSIPIPSQSGARTLRVGASMAGMAGSSGSLLLDELAFDEIFSSSATTFWMAVLWVTSPEGDSVDALRRIETSQAVFLLHGKEARRFVARSAEKYRAMLSFPVALVCGLGLVSLQGLLFGAIRSRRREFELLRASGATRKNVVAIVTLGGSVVGVLGALIGIAIGTIWSSVVCGFLSQSVGWTIRPLLSPDLGVLVFAGATALALVGSLVPALLSTRARGHAWVQTP